jgi:O-antigen/teichoic acid export membrane protein
VHSCTTRPAQEQGESVAIRPVVAPMRERERSVVQAPTQNAIHLLVARGFFMVSSYFVSIMLARGLGPLEYGVYGVIVSVLMWIEALGSAGVPAATAQLLPQHQHQMPEVEQAARLLLLLSSLLLFAISWWMAPTLANLFDMPTGTALFRLAILDIPLSGIYCAYQGILSGHRRFGSQGVAFIIYGFTKLAGILTLFALGLTVSAALVVNALATGSVLAYLVVRFPPRGPLPSYALLRSMGHLAIPMGLYLICLQLLLSLDLWSLKAFNTGSGEAIGIYVAALNVAKVLGIVPPVLTGILFASLAWALVRADEGAAQRLIQASGRFALIILLPICTLLTLHSQAVLMLLYTGVYATGGTYLGLQLITFMLLSFLDMFFNAITVAGKPYHAAGILLALIPIALLFNLLLIPKFGPLGAATALMLTTGLATLMAAFLAYQRFGPLLRLKTIVNVAASTAIITLISLWIPVMGFWFLLKFFILLIIYLLVLSLLRELSFKSLFRLLIFRKRPILDSI